MGVRSCNRGDGARGRLSLKIDQFIASYLKVGPLYYINATLMVSKGAGLGCRTTPIQPPHYAFAGKTWDLFQQIIHLLPGEPPKVGQNHGAHVVLEHRVGLDQSGPFYLLRLLLAGGRIGG